MCFLVPGESPATVSLFGVLPGLSFLFRSEWFCGLFSLLAQIKGFWFFKHCLLQLVLHGIEVIIETALEFVAVCVCWQ